MSKPTLSIVLPCYNEAENIPVIFSRFREILADRKDVEVLLVNNGSSDNSSAVFACESAKPEHAFARVVEVEENQGYGYGILAGLKEGGGAYLGWTHADMQTDPADVLEGLELLRAQEDPATCLIKGKRQQRPFFDTFFTGGMSWVSSMALNARLNDVNGQPKIFSRSYYEEMTDPPHDFSLDLFLLYDAQRRGLKILEQPVYFNKRMHGESKGGGTFKGKIKLIRRTFAYIMDLRRKVKGG